MNDSADTIEDLQSRLVFQEDAIEHLNKTVAEQASQIDILRQQLSYLHDQIKQISEQQPETGTMEIPPHY